MMYYKITDKDSKAWNLHELFQLQHKEVREQLDDIINIFNLPQKAYTRGGAVVGFERPEDESDIPEGMRVAKAGYMKPDRRTKIGKQIHEELKSIEFPSNAQYMRNIFGKDATAITEPNRMTTGCTSHSNDHVVVISIHPKVLKTAQKSDAFQVPSGLQEITGSEYQDLKENL